MDETDMRRLRRLLIAISASSNASPDEDAVVVCDWRRTDARESRAGKGVRLRT